MRCVVVTMLGAGALLMVGRAAAESQVVSSGSLRESFAAMVALVDGKQATASMDTAQNNKDALAQYSVLKDSAALGKVGIDTAVKARDLGNAYKALSPDDSAIQANTDRAAPRVPSACAEQGGSGCGACYSDAYAHLNRLRFNFEKLRAIGMGTENFVKRSIAFGDSASGIHGITGLAWQSERAKIEQSLVEFNKIYDRKYRELIGTAGEVLHQIGECEAKYLKNPDWYDRYGYIYYSFLEDRYRR
jgi:hypothetical protein